jgi:hypothetical protein
MVAHPWCQLSHRVRANIATVRHDSGYNGANLINWTPFTLYRWQKMMGKMKLIIHFNQ